MTQTLPLTTMLPSALTDSLREVTHWYDEWAGTPTAVDVDALRNSDVRSTVREWDVVRLQIEGPLIWVSSEYNAAQWNIRALTPTGRDFTVVIVDRPDVDAQLTDIPAAHGASPAIRAVEDIEARLGLPLQRVLKAAGVKRRTFYAWRKKPEVQPRVHSLGRLWSLGQCIEDLESELPDVPSWLRDPQRLHLLERGNFDALIDLAVATFQPVGSAMQSQTLYEGDDRVVPELRHAGERPPLKPVRRTSRGH